MLSVKKTRCGGGCAARLYAQLAYKVRYVFAKIFRQPALILQVICYFAQLVQVIWHICVFRIKEESTSLSPTLLRPGTRDDNKMGSLEFRCLGDDQSCLVA